jgi:hypothetical protein
MKMLALGAALVGLLVFALPVLEANVAGSSDFNSSTFILVDSLSESLTALTPFVILSVAAAVILVGIRGVF